MSKHIIHGMTVKVEVHQGNLTDMARGQCVGKVVNICREIDAEAFKAAMTDNHIEGYTALLTKLDNALAENYTKRYVDEFTPIANIAIVSEATA